MKWKPVDMNEWMNEWVREWTEVKYAVRETEQLKCDKPAEWHTRCPVHEPIHTGHVTHTAVVGNFFYIV